MHEMAHHGGGITFWDLAPSFILLLVIIGVLVMVIKELLK